MGEFFLAQVPAANKEGEFDASKIGFYSMAGGLREGSCSKGVLSLMTNGDKLFTEKDEGGYRGQRSFVVPMVEMGGDFPE